MVAFISPEGGSFVLVRVRAERKSTVELRYGIAAINGIDSCCGPSHQWKKCYHVFKALVVFSITMSQDENESLRTKLIVQDEH